METQSQDKKGKKGIFWIILLILSVLLNVYQWQNHSTSVNKYEQKVDTLVVERVNVLFVNNQYSVKIIKTVKINKIVKIIQNRGIRILEKMFDFHNF